MAAKIVNLANPDEKDPHVVLEKLRKRQINRSLFI